MRIWTRSVALAAVLVLAACATVPTGPDVMVLPGAGKSFDQFRSDDETCREWAAERSGGEPRSAAAHAGASSAAVGTIVGAGAGAAIGAAAGNPGIGAAVGAGSGLLVGSAAGADAGAYGGSVLQRRYDMSYAQCMYASGHQIPGTRSAHSRRRMPPPPGSLPPPPPPPVR